MIRHLLAVTSKVGTALALLASTSASAVTIDIFPDCPRPDASVRLVLSSAGGGPYFFGPYEAPWNEVRVTRTGNDFKVVVNANTSSFPVPDSHSEAVFGTLPIGRYQVDIFYRIPAIQPGGGITLSDERTLGSVGFEVREEAASNCKPATMAVTKGGFMSALVGTAFGETLEVTVNDGQGRPVSGLSLEPSLISRPDATTAQGLPAATLRPLVPTTGIDGTVRYTVAANGAPGLYQYAFTAIGSPGIRPVYAVLHNAKELPAGAVLPVVEFYNADLKQFFITSSHQEMQMLDGVAMWQRTGDAFLAYPAANGGLPGGGAPVCRYYGRPEVGNHSHFYSASAEECNAVAARFPNSWQLETHEMYRSFLPDLATGACPPELAPVYRASSTTAPNHRYSTSRSVITQLVQTQAWVAEGYGPEAVVMCVPR